MSDPEVQSQATPKRVLAVDFPVPVVSAVAVVGTLGAGALATFVARIGLNEQRFGSLRMVQSDVMLRG